MAGRPSSSADKPTGRANRPPAARPSPPPPEDPPRRRRGPRITRDIVLFTAGLLLLIYEAVLRAGEPRASLLLLYAGMMGLPAAFQADGVLAQILQQRRDPTK